jgi:hypothetical protein
MDEIKGFSFLKNTNFYDARFAIYLPDTQRTGYIFTQEEFDIHKEYVIDVLANLFDGATAMPPTDARWIGDDEANAGKKIMTKEKTTVVYSFCTVGDLKANENELDKLIDYVGKKMNQQAVAVEIASIFYLRTFPVN